MEHLPSDMRMAAARMSNYNRNKFRLETVSADTAGPGRIVTVNLPENALLDMKSLRLHMDVLTTSSTEGAATVYGRLPADASSLISRLEVYCNGIQLTQGAAEYGTIAKLLKVCRSSRDKDGSVDRALSHGSVSATDAVEDVSLVISDWKGFLGECSTRFLPTDLLGQIQIRITFAGNEVLVPKEAAVGLNANFGSADARTAAARVSYSVSEMYWSIDSVQIDDTYSQLLRQRLAQEEFIPLNYKEYYSWSLDNITTGSHTVRFSLSAASIDRLYATCRDSNHQTAGVRGFQMDATLADNLGSNALRFRNFNDSTTKAGSLRYQWSINNVKRPQYRASVIDALADLAHAGDKVHDSSSGNLVTSLAQYSDGLFVCPLQLSHPGEPIAVQSGYSSKGINTSLLLEISGQTVPTASTAAQTTAAISTFVVAETTAQLRVGLGRNIAISF